MPERSRTLQLRHETLGENSRFLSAYLDAQGHLHIDGQDLGPSTGSVSSDGEYEWFQVIQASDLPRLIAALGGRPDEPILELLERRFSGKASYELERVLRTGEIPVHREVWSG